MVEVCITAMKLFATLAQEFYAYCVIIATFYMSENIFEWNHCNKWARCVVARDFFSLGL